MLEVGMLLNHILDLHDGLLYNCLVKRRLGKTQRDFALIAEIDSRLSPGDSGRTGPVEPENKETIKSSIQERGL